MRVLAVDYGEKRLGLALGDTVLKTAIPLSPRIRSNIDADMHFFQKVLSDYEIDRIILGCPLLTNGTMGPMAKRVERFAHTLKKQLNINVVSVDERLSTKEAEQLNQNFGGQSKKRKDRIDSLAAMVILQYFLDGL